MSRHDCVVVPGLGAFVAQYTPAAIDYQRGVICPPQRQIAFNPSIDHNDGLLASSIARALAVTYSQAADIVAADVAAIKRQLDTDGRVEIAHVGSLNTLDGGALDFHPADSPLSAPAYFGLQPTAIVSVREAAREEAIASGEYVPEHPTMSVGQRVFAGLRVAASVAVLFGMGFLLSTPIAVDRDSEAMATMNPVASVSAPKKAQVPSALTPVAQAREVATHQLNIAIPTEGVATLDTIRRNNYAAQIAQIKVYNQLKARQAGVNTAQTSSTTKPSSSERRYLDSDRYCLIVGSLPTLAEAEKFVVLSGDASLHIIEMGGKYRVCAATGATYAQAAAASSSLGRTYPGAWVCRR